MQSKTLSSIFFWLVLKLIKTNIIIWKLANRNSNYRVKLAVDKLTNKQVAIKFLKVLPGVSKHKALECLHREIKILVHCDHPNIAKIKEASFDGTIIKESIMNDSSPKPSEGQE